MTDYAAWKVAQLRAELKRRGLPSSGNKNDLVTRLQADDLVARPKADDDQADDEADNPNPVDTIPPPRVSGTPARLRDDASTLVDQLEARSPGNIQKGKRRLSPSPSGDAGPSRQDDQRETATMSTTKRRRMTSTIQTTDATNIAGILSVLQDACRDPNDFPHLEARLLSTVEQFCHPGKLQRITDVSHEEPASVADELGISDQKERERYIQQLVDKDYGVSEGTGFVWAAYYLMPLEQLQANTDNPYPGDFKNTLILQGKGLIDMWLAKSKESDDSIPTPLGSRASSKQPIGRILAEGRNDTPPMGRSKKAREACRLRDKDVCVFTGWENPYVAHIYPFAMNKKDLPVFWGLLSRLWGDKKAKEWKEVVGAGTEKCSNLICLTPSLHRWWGKARFALKPTRVSTNELRLQFFWLQRANHGPNDKVNLLTSPEHVLTEQQCHRGFNPIDNGAVFTIKADKPDELPSFEILDMQWHLQRLAAMCGAADVDPEVFSDDDSETPLRGRTLQRQGDDWEWYEPEERDHRWSEREVMSEHDGSLMDEMFSAGSTSIMV